MRNKARISEILNRLEAVWYENPDLRLGQLVSNGGGDNVFYIEDEDLIDSIENVCADTIYTFHGENRFLSNFYISEFFWRDLTWHTSENAYQAAKSNDPEVWKRFADPTLTAGQAKKLGRTIEMRPDWDEVKDSIMKEILRHKFYQSLMLRSKLISTYGKKLEEGNSWGDTYWGISPEKSGTGQNKLGILLMEVREDLLNGR